MFGKNYYKNWNFCNLGMNIYLNQFPENECLE